MSFTGIYSYKIKTGYSLNVTYIFTCLILCQLLVLLITNYLLIEDSLYYDFWGSKLSYERITKIIEENKRWKWVGFAFLPLFTTIKCFFISSCLYIGSFFGKNDKGFANFFRVSLLAEFTTLLPSIVKIIWFGFLNRDYSLQDLTYYSPLSALSLLNQELIDPWFIYPLQLLNAFEVVYWLTLAHLLKELIDKSLSQRIGFVASTYGAGLFIWILFVTFITVSLS